MPLGITCALQLADVQVPDIAAGEGGATLVQPPGPAMGPEMEAVRVPETLVPATVPAMVPLSAHRAQATENGMEKDPLLLTTVVPEAGDRHDMSGVAFSGTLTVSA
jgi:hypothetical protein